MEKKFDIQYVDRSKAPVASNQPRENLVRLYVFYFEIYSILNIFIYSNYHEDNEGLVNRQINLELYASYVYSAMAHHFDRSDVALKGKKISMMFFLKTFFYYLGHHNYFKKMAEEENEHANKFMEYQNKRGGTIVLLDIKVC
jgi:hypothetical protein